MIDTSLIFENVPIALFYKDDKNTMLKVNNEYLRIFGFKRKDIEGKNCYDLFPTEQARKFHNDDLEVIKSGTPKKGIVEPVTTSSGLFMCRTDKVPHIDKNNKITGIVGFTLDITQETNIQAELANLKRAIEQSPSTVVITDTTGNIKYVNPKFSEVTGYNYKEVLNKNPRLLKSGKLSEAQYKQMWSEITSGKVWRGEFLNKTKNGKLYWEIASIAPVKNNEGTIISYIKVAEIITDLRETMVNLWNVLDYASYFVVILNDKMEVKLCNKSLAKFLGFEDEHMLVGRKWIDFIPKSEQKLIRHIHAEILEEDDSKYREVTTEIISKEGRIVPVKWFNSSINHKYHMTFSLGTPVVSELYQDNIDNTREFFERLLEKDRMTIQVIRDRIKKENGE